MLPSQLLIARKSGDTVRPVYAADTERFLWLARSIIGVYSNGVGKKHFQLSSEIRELERGQYDFRLVRGLALLLERRSVFEVVSPVDPYKLRAAIFSLSCGFAGDPAERSHILAAVGEEFRVNPADIESLMWSDLEEEKVLRSFDPPDPSDLLASYNLSLTQTLLFKATSLEIRVEGNWKNIFRSIRYLGLMYSLTKDGEGLLLSVEGPTAIIKLTERYGTNLAKLIPEILLGGSWAIRAQIVSRWKEERRLLTFTLRSSEGVPLPRPANGPDTYDSSLESSFARRFNALGSRWNLLREPEPISTGPSVMIPDFAFELGSTRVYFEIVGFWTPDYLSRKISKLQSARGVDMIIAVDSSLGITKRLPGRVIPFEGEIPLRPILDYLETKENALTKYELEQTLNVPIRVDGACVEIGGLAADLGVSEDALTRKIAENPVAGYTLIGDCLIRSDRIKLLEKIVESYSGAGKGCVSDLAPKLEAEGIADPYPLLKFLGYRVTWKGLEGSAEYSKPKGNQ